MSEFDTQLLSLEFDSEHDKARVCSALAFGAATAGLLSPPDPPADRADACRLLSAIFNLGIGLLDGLCDTRPDTGSDVLERIDRCDMAAHAGDAHPRGWLRAQLSHQLESDPTVSFATDIVETFFAVLHATYPGRPWAQLRSHAGHQLAAALAAERSSIAGSHGGVSREQLTRSSYATSVLPFEIIGALAQRSDEPTRARLLGEAMWRIDDLVDLCDDTRSGALNAILVDTSGAGVAALEDLLASDRIAQAAEHAADDLLRVVEQADSHGHDMDVVLQFVSLYAGVAPKTSL